MYDRLYEEVREWYSFKTTGCLFFQLDERTGSVVIVLMDLGNGCNGSTRSQEGFFLSSSSVSENKSVVSSLS